MFRPRINSILALILVLSLNETGCQHFGPRDAGYITRYRKKSSIMDDHQGYTEVDENHGRSGSDSARKARETLMDSNPATNHEAYSKRRKNYNVDESLRFLERAGRGMQNRHISLLPDEDEVVDLESLPGKELKLTRLACNYSKQNNHADSTGGNLPAGEKITEIGAERPLKEGHMVKAKEVLEKKWTSEALSRNEIPIHRGGAVNYRIVTVYPKSRLTLDNVLNFGIITVVVVFLFINISRQGQKLFKPNHERSCTSQHQTLPQEPPTLNPTPPSEETELQMLTRPCDNCLTLTEVIDELLAYLSSSKVFISKLENQIRNLSTQRHGEASPPQMTRENSESDSENDLTTLL